MKRRVLLNNEKHRTDVPYVEIGGVKWATTSLITDVRTGKNYFAEKPEDLGSVFQWGRRYGASSTVTSSQSGQLSIAQGENLSYANRLVGNPYSSSPGTYHYAWCSETGTSAYSKLWTPSKGEYDPCPDGWRVPTKDELNTLYSASYKLKGYKDGVFGYFFGKNSQDTMFVPFQPMEGWIIGTLDASFVAILSCTLGANNSHYLLDFMKGSNEMYLRTLYQATSGVIRAVKI